MITAVLPTKGGRFFCFTRKSNVIQNEAKNLEYIKWMFSRFFAMLWMTKCWSCLFSLFVVEIQGMTHSFLFSLQIPFVVFVRGDFDRDILFY